jgi:cephalosporin hydroxylase
LTDALILADAVRPEVIVEIGCDRGGTLYAWRKICLRVYGITTVDNGFASGGSGGALQHHGATVIHGDSHDPATLRTLLDLLDYHPVDVLVIDGDHHLAGVRQDFEWYGSLVRPGGLIMLHDIAVSNDPRAEVDQFWPELIRKFEPARVTEIQSRQHAPFGWGVIRA